MTRLILHIGHGKTGSTAIQRALLAEAATLGAHGILFPHPVRHDNHQVISPALTGTLPTEPVQMQTLAPSTAAAWKAADAAMDALARDVATGACHTVIYSNELAFRPWSDAEFEHFAKVTAPLFDRIEVIAYLRDPVSFLLSAVQQDLKKRPDFLPISASRYRDTLEPFARRYPVTAVAFDRATLTGGDAVADFAARLLPDAVRAQVIAAARPANETFSAEAISVMQDFFRGTVRAPSGWYARRPQRFKRLVAEADAAVPGYTRPRLLPGLGHVARARATDLGWLAETFGVDFRGDTGGIGQAEAEAVFDRLRDIADFTPVDSARRAALIAHVGDAARAETTPRAWLRRLIYR